MPVRYQKLVEFSAHAGDVNCVKIGRKTNGVMVTGGEDKKVNLWAIGKTSAQLSLSGHQSAVESVTFDKEEEMVAAGAASGSIKIFDLSSAKVTRTLAQHKSNVLCLEFHPFGTSMVSGSMDTNVKVWDLRSKDVAQTYKGHDAAVTHARFSPDGRWVATGSRDGAVKIWDLAAGKQVADLTGHAKAEISGLEFHPSEFLLATSSKDKTVKFWDLETFSQTCQAGPEAIGVRGIVFHPDGRHVFSALQDGMRVWSWEPSISHDFVDVPWSRLCDMVVFDYRGHQRVMGCSFNSTLVGVYYIGLKKVHPFCDDPDFMAGEGTDRSTDSLPSHSSSSLLQQQYQYQQLQQPHSQPQQQSRSSANPPSKPSERNGGVAPLRQGPGMASAVVDYVVRTQAVRPAPSETAAEPPAHAFRATPHQSPPRVPVPISSSNGHVMSLESDARSAPAHKSNSRYPPTFSIPADPPPAEAAPSAARMARNLTDPGSTSNGGSTAAPNYSHANPQVHPQGGHHAQPLRHLSAPRLESHPAEARPPLEKPNMVSIAVGVGDSLMRGQVEPGGLSSLAAQVRKLSPELRALSVAAPSHQQTQSQQQQLQQQQPPQQQSNQHADAAADLPPTRPQRVIGLVQRSTTHTGSGSSSEARDRADSSSAHPTAAPSGRPASALQDRGPEAGGKAATAGGLEFLKSMQDGHDASRVLLMQRLSTAQMLRSFLGRGDVRGALACARRSGDVGAWSDLFGVLLARREVPFTLDLVADVVALADQVLSSPLQRQASIALDVISLQLKAFGPVIRDTCSSAARVGIDLSFEQRREKCAAAKMALQGLVSKLSLMAQRSSLTDLDVARAQDLAHQLSAL